jgi:hypothetical protein
MPAQPIRSFVEYMFWLRDSIAAMKKVVAKHPTETEFQSILAQLEALENWTKGQVPLDQAKRDQLNYGQLASRYLHPIEPDLSSDLYEIADYVRSWR